MTPCRHTKLIVKHVDKEIGKPRDREDLILECCAPGCGAQFELRDDSVAMGLFETVIRAPDFNANNITDVFRKEYNTYRLGYVLCPEDCFFVTSLPNRSWDPCITPLLPINDAAQPPPGGYGWVKETPQTKDEIANEYDKEMGESKLKMSDLAMGGLTRYDNVEVIIRVWKLLEGEEHWQLWIKFENDQEIWISTKPSNDVWDFFRDYITTLQPFTLQFIDGKPHTIFGNMNCDNVQKSFRIKGLVLESTVKCP